MPAYAGPRRATETELPLAPTGTTGVGPSGRARSDPLHDERSALKLGLPCSMSPLSKPAAAPRAAPRQRLACPTALLELELPEDGTYVVMVSVSEGAFFDADADGFPEEPISLFAGGLGAPRRGSDALLVYSNQAAPRPLPEPSG